MAAGGGGPERRAGARGRIPGARGVDSARPARRGSLRYAIHPSSGRSSRLRGASWIVRAVVVAVVAGAVARWAGPSAPGSRRRGPRAEASPAPRRARRATRPRIARGPRAITRSRRSRRRATSVRRRRGPRATVSHPPGTSTFHASGDRSTVETVGPDGKPLVVPLSYVVGRRRIRMYVTALPAGAHQVLPAMREEGTGAWFDYTQLLFGAPGLPPDQAPTVAPGDPSFWTGPVRSFDARCARCHVSGREAVAPAAGRHGPSLDAGVPWASTARPATGRAPTTSRCGVPCPAARSAIRCVRLRDLDRDASLGVCLSCHLEGEVVDPAFAPGKDLFEHVDPTLLDDAERVDPAGRPLELVYEGLGFLVSRCVEKGKLTCASCHASHGSPHGASLVAPVDRRRPLLPVSHPASPRRSASTPTTGAAGAARGASRATCRRCPVERGHGAVTDHSISTPDLTGSAGVRVSRDACTGCHTGARGFARGCAAARRRGAREGVRERGGRTAKPRPPWSKAIAAARRAIRRRGAASRPSPATRRRPVSCAPPRWRCSDASPAPTPRRSSRARRTPTPSCDAPPSRRSRRFAAEDADAALLAALADPSPAVRARAARAALAGWERAQANATLLRAALPVLEEQTRAAPDDDGRWFRLAAARQIAGDLAGAAAAYERQCALDPFASNARATLEKIRARLAKGRSRSPRAPVARGAWTTRGVRAGTLTQVSCGRPYDQVTSIESPSFAPRTWKGGAFSSSSRWPCGGRAAPSSRVPWRLRGGSPRCGGAPGTDRSSPSGARAPRCRAW